MNIGEELFVFTCVNENLGCGDPRKRFLCKEEGVCKTTYQTCGGRCLKPCRSSSEHYYCKDKTRCVSEYNGCEDGCPADQLYCMETGSCHTTEQPCYGECRVRFKGKKSSQHQYCEATHTCTPYSTPCNGRCRPYDGQGQKPQEDDQYPLPDAPTVLCSGLDLCYVAELPQSVVYVGTYKAKQKCLHHELKCGKDEYVNKGKCVPLSTHAYSRSSLTTNDRYINGTRFSCVRKYGGVFHNYRWCSLNNMCIPPDQPCNGKCKRSKPRMSLCEAEGKCINIKNLCAGQCLVDRVKCAEEDKCIHKSAVGDGTQQCLGKN